MNLKKVISQIESAILANAIKNDAYPDLFEDAYKTYIRMDALIEKHGDVIEDERGSLKLNPACREKKDAKAQMFRILEQCGLTPKAKKANAPKSAYEDPIDEIPDL